MIRYVYFEGPVNVREPLMQLEYVSPRSACDCLRKSIRVPDGGTGAHVCRHSSVTHSPPSHTKCDPK